MEKQNYTITGIAELLNAEAFLPCPCCRVTKLVTDTRNVGNGIESVFFAIKGQRDGHHFIKDAYEKGIRNFVVSDSQINHRYPSANFIVVRDVIKALQQLAAFHRAQFSINVIGITGSNGKTIVKEWLYQLLSSDHNIVRSPKSFNSQLGVPLSVWQINESDNLGIFEAGISTTGEMENLQKVIQPTIGILTNLGEAHAEGFANKTEKLNEKLKLFKGVKTLIYSPDYADEGSIQSITNHFFTWSFRQKADLEITEITKQGKLQLLTANYNGEKISCETQFSDQASVENIVICWATLLALGCKQEEIQERIQRIHPISMRLQLINGIENCSIIDDSYSADISSLTIALDFLNQQNQYAKKTLILSDIFESGKTDNLLYKEVADLIRQKKVGRLIGIGEKIKSNASLFELESSFYNSTAEFIDDFKITEFSNETILIKGARKFEFEKITKLLAQKIHDTVLEVNLNALAANVQYYRSKLKPGTKLMAMVKAFSYGSGSFEIANLLQFHQVDYLAVAYADEGIALRKARIKLPIMVMSPEPAAFEAIVRYNLEPEIYNIEILNSFLHFLDQNKSAYPIHIKLDTGMHRLGFEQSELTDLLLILKSNSKIKVVSVFSHLVGSADEKHDDFTKHQLKQFTAIYDQLIGVLNYQPIRHVLNTAGISRWGDAQFDMVRLGIGMYGFDSALQTGELQTVATLKTTVTQIKHLAAGETVGYGRRGILPNGGTTATVKIGYADGYNRSFGNGVGKMLINGRYAPTIGGICMDMTMLDVTGINLKVGDEVIVFNEKLTISTLAEQINTIPYEILTNISQRVKRVYFYE